MLGGANLLVLDEPADHLDVESIEALEDAVANYGGSGLLISHDPPCCARRLPAWGAHDSALHSFSMAI